MEEPLGVEKPCQGKDAVAGREWTSEAWSTNGGEADGSVRALLCSCALQPLPPLLSSSLPTALVHAVGSFSFYVHNT